MEQTIHFGGTPTAPQVRKLKEHFADPRSLRGRVIPHEEIEQVIGETRARNATRYRTVTTAWRRQVEAEHGVVISGRGTGGVGFAVLVDAEQLTFGVGQRRSAARKIRRWHNAVATTNVAHLKPEDRAVREHELTAASRVHAALMETRRYRPLLRPTPVDTSVTRSLPSEQVRD